MSGCVVVGIHSGQQTPPLVRRVLLFIGSVDNAPSRGN